MNSEEKMSGKLTADSASDRSIKKQHPDIQAGATKIAELEEVYKMPYITSWERIAEKKGVKIGEEKGKIKTARELIKRGVAINIIAEATGFSQKKIEKLSATAH
jgi:predicted transposase/invertase (TIGR01784 family)